MKKLFTVLLAVLLLLTVLPAGMVPVSAQYPNDSFLVPGSTDIWEVQNGEGWDYAPPGQAGNWIDVTTNSDGSLVLQKTADSLLYWPRIRTTPSSSGHKIVLDVNEKNYLKYDFTAEGEALWAINIECNDGFYIFAFSDDIMREAGMNAIEMEDGKPGTYKGQVDIAQVVNSSEVIMKVFEEDGLIIERFHIFIVCTNNNDRLIFRELSVVDENGEAVVPLVPEPSSKPEVPMWPPSPTPDYIKIVDLLRIAPWNGEGRIDCQLTNEGRYMTHIEPITHVTVPLNVTVDVEQVGYLYLSLHGFGELRKWNLALDYRDNRGNTGSINIADCFNPGGWYGDFTGALPLIDVFNYIKKANTQFNLNDITFTELRFFSALDTGESFMIGDLFLAQHYTETPIPPPDQAFISMPTLVQASQVISSGFSHSMAIQRDGSLWVWGTNVYGKLGDGTDDNRGVPIKIMDDVVAAAAGTFHSLAVKADSSLWAWGYNGYGELGIGLDAGLVLDRPVKVMDGVKSVAAGNGISYAIKEDGSLWAWGKNEYGQIGDGTVSTYKFIGNEHVLIIDNNQYTPIKIMDDVVSVVASDYHTMALKTDGSLWTWGANYDGALGTGRETTYPIFGNIEDGIVDNNQYMPVKIMEYVSAIAVSNAMSLALRYDGSLWQWGAIFQCTDDGESIRTRSQLVPLHVMDDVASMAAGSYNVFAVKHDGNLWAWGENYKGALDIGTNTSSAEPMLVTSGVAAVSAGYLKGCLVKTDGSLWSWGANGAGEVGDGTFENRNVPVQIMSQINLPSKWAQEDVYRALMLDLVPTALLNHYRADITRAEFCALAVPLYEKLNGPIAALADFNDTDDLNVRKMGSLGVVQGVGDGRFNPDAPITRQEAATILCRLMDALGQPLTASAPSFADHINSWARDAVGAVQAAGIMEGTGSNHFSPKGSYTREQSIVTLLRVWESIAAA